MNYAQDQNQANNVISGMCWWETHRCLLQPCRLVQLLYTDTTRYRDTCPDLHPAPHFNMDSNTVSDSDADLYFHTKSYAITRGDSGAGSHFDTDGSA